MNIKIIFKPLAIVYIKDFRRGELHIGIYENIIIFTNGSNSFKTQKINSVPGIV